MSQSNSAPSVSAFADLSFETTSISELENALNNLISSQSLTPLTRSGALDGMFAFHGCPDLGVFDVRFGRKLSIDLPPEANDERQSNFAFVMTRNGSARMLHGSTEFDYSHSKGIIFSGGARTLQFSDDCDSETLLLNRARVTQCCSNLLGHELDRPIALDVQFDLESESGQRWQRTVQYASAELRSRDSLIRQAPAFFRQVEQMVHTTLLYSQPHTYLQALLTPQSAAAPFYVRRAESYIEAHLSEPLTLSDIAAHARVSARSLQNGFRDFRHTTPMAFVRALRMEKVHQTLLAADPSMSTVTEIAFQYGFTHMGDFTTHYKKRFGVTPSQTLHRSR